MKYRRRSSPPTKSEVHVLRTKGLHSHGSPTHEQSWTAVLSALLAEVLHTGRLAHQLGHTAPRRPHLTTKRHRPVPRWRQTDQRLPRRQRGNRPSSVSRKRHPTHT